MNGRIVITGAAGFVGRYLVEHLAGTREVEAWTRSAPPVDSGRPVRWRQLDLLDREAVRAAIKEARPDAVYHCAGSTHVAQSWKNTAQPLEVNVLGTHYLLDAIRRAGVRCRVLVPGSATVYAPSPEPIAESHPLGPGNPYALSKLAQEQLALKAAADDGVEVVLTRSFNHTGPRQTADFAAPAMARQVALIDQGLAEPVIKVGNLEARRDLTDVRDVVRAYVLLMQAAAPGTIYNVASGVGHRIGAVLDALIARARVAVRIETDPARLRPNDFAAVIGDASRLRTATGWQPAISFDQMLDDLLDYWRVAVRAG